MYTLKSLGVTKNPNTLIPGERLLLWARAVFTDGTADELIEFKAENKDVIDDTLRSIIKRLEERDAFIKNTNFNTYTIPAIVVPVPVVKTPEQVKNELIIQKENELVASLAEAEREQKIAELSVTNPDLALKLAELETLKVPVVIK